MGLSFNKIFSRDISEYEPLINELLKSSIEEQHCTSCKWYIANINYPSECEKGYLPRSGGILEYGYCFDWINKYSPIVLTERRIICLLRRKQKPLIVTFTKLL